MKNQNQLEQVFPENEKTPTGTLLKHLLPGVGVLVIITIVVGLLMNYLL